MGRRKIVIVDDKLVLGLISDKRILDILPALADAMSVGRQRLHKDVKSGNCKTCQIKFKQYAVDAMSVKKALVELSASDKVKFKDFLNTEQVKIVFKSKDGSITQVDY